jgi:hypothetical protein
MWNIARINFLDYLPGYNSFFVRIALLSLLSIYIVSFFSYNKITKINIKSILSAILLGIILKTIEMFSFIHISESVNTMITRDIISAYTIGILENVFSYLSVVLVFSITILIVLNSKKYCENRVTIIKIATPFLLSLTTISYLVYYIVFMMIFN